MRERLDCAVLTTTCNAQWISQWTGKHSGGRLCFHAFDGLVDSARADSCRVLADAYVRLRRFDVCLLSVSETNLPWVRTTLSAAQGVVSTPIVGLVRQLKAAALNDLYTLGLSDFIRDPVCPEELRARIERLLDRHAYAPPSSAVVAEPRELLGGYRIRAHDAAAITEDALCACILDRSGTELEAYAVASASRCATSRESFRAAKGKVIERFERAYITAALGRHSGNIAMAARAAQKHRRAFWALMRKHQIDAAPFRHEAAPNHAQDG